MSSVLFIQGAGSVGAHVEDRALARSLEQELGQQFQVRYPLMPNEAEPDFQTWRAVILKEAANLSEHVVLAGHSIGASVLAKIMTEPGRGKPLCRAVCLVAAPFWHDDAFWNWPECTLRKDAAHHWPAGVPLFLYHGDADPFVPPAHLDMYAKALPHALVRRLPGRDHQLSEDLREVALDIARLA